MADKQVEAKNVDHSMFPLQVVTDAKTLVKRYKKLLRQ